VKKFLVRIAGSTEWTIVESESSLALGLKYKEEGIAATIKPYNEQEKAMKTPEQKNGFQNTFLSNFWPVEIVYQDLVYPSVENFYQAMKTSDKSKHQIFTKITAADAKKRGQSLTFRADWEQLKLVVMTHGIRAKFAVGSDLANQLLLTGSVELVEYNYWHDNFWGDCTCQKCKDIEGQNNLGKIIMQIRNELRGKQTTVSNVVQSENKPPEQEKAMPKVHNKHANTAPKNAVYIGRPSKWGNPFVIGKDGTREEVIAKYRDYILGNAQLLAGLHELEGKDLVCFCAPQACHGDVLINLANGNKEEIVNKPSEQEKTMKIEDLEILKGKFVIAGTGTRQLIKESQPYRHKVLNYLVELLNGAKKKHGAENVVVISGMAEGFDEALARAAVIAGVPFVAALPNSSYIQYYWSAEHGQTGVSRIQQGMELLGKAAKVVNVCNFKGAKANYIRNEWMADRASIVWVYNPNNSSGTKHCVEYCGKIGRAMFNIVVDKDDDGGNTPMPNDPKPTEPQQEKTVKTPPPAEALIKRELLSPETQEWLIDILENEIAPLLEADVSNYAKGRMRTWMPYFAPLDSQRNMNQPFTPGVLHPELWQFIVDLCAKHGMQAQTCLISKGGNISPHRDTTYAAAWAMGINLGECNWHIAASRDLEYEWSEKNNKFMRSVGRGAAKKLSDLHPGELYSMDLSGGEVFSFNSKHVHAVRDAAPSRWAINVWAIADTGAAKTANIHGRLAEMLEQNPEVAEFINQHQPGATTQVPKEDTIVNNEAEKVIAEAMKEVQENKKQKKTATISLDLGGGIILNPEQADAFTAATEGKGNMLITGNAGTGKSFLVNQIVSRLEEQGKKVMVVASTGIAATHIGGRTFHSELRIFPKFGPIARNWDAMVSSTVDDMASGRFGEERIAYWKTIDVVIVDEVSMLHPQDLARADAALRIAMKKPNVPFGGMRFIFVGDFLQLEPVHNGCLCCMNLPKGQETKTNYSFQTKAWSTADIKVFQLTKIVRQQDIFFAGILSNFRQGIWTKQMADFIKSRMCEESQLPEGTVFLMTHKNQVLQRNNNELNKINNDLVSFESFDRLSYKKGKMTPEQVSAWWDKQTLVPRIVSLKVGAQVMHLVNEGDLCNGDVGTVQSMSETTEVGIRWVEVYWPRLGRATIVQDTRVHQGDPDFEYRMQLPLMLSWAITVHKAQGMTIDKAAVYIDKAFAKGHVYVALSRLRTPEGLYVVSFDSNSSGLLAHQAALDFYGLTGNIKGDDAEVHCNVKAATEDISDDDEDNDDDGGATVNAPVDPTPNNDNNRAVQDNTENKEEEVKEPKEEVAVTTMEERLVNELNKLISQQKAERMKKMDDRPIREYVIEMDSIDVDGLRIYGRVITNDPDYWLNTRNTKVYEEINRGSYYYALLDFLFGDKSFAVHVMSFTDPRTEDEETGRKLTAEERIQLVDALANKPIDVAFAYADFDALTTIRIKDYRSTDFDDMWSNYGLHVGNSAKMVKRLVELVKPVRGFLINVGDRRERIKLLTAEDFFTAFPQMKTEDPEIKSGDGISLISMETVLFIFKQNPYMSKSARRRLERDIKNKKITNVTLRVITNIDGTPGLVKGNALIMDRKTLNKSLRDKGVIGKDETYDIITSAGDNFKTEFGTDGSWEFVSVEPHHGPGIVKTNDQTMAQFMYIPGVMDPTEILEAFKAVMDKTYNNLVEGKDIELFANIRSERATTEAEKLNQAVSESREITNMINHFVGTLNELELPMNVSQTLMFRRAQGIRKMFLSKNQGLGNNWKASSREKKSFMFMPWAYRAYIMPKPILALMGYDIDLNNDEAFYHEETQTFAIPAKLVVAIMAALGGGDFDDEVMVHIRRMIMKDGSTRLVALLIRTPNDWAEYYIVDVDVDKFGPVFIAEEDGIDLPTIYEADFDKFAVTSVAGTLPSGQPNGTPRPSADQWSWDLTLYNASVARHKASGVGGQVKTKMLQYSINDAPFAVLPCANEDMIDALQQCKATVEDATLLTQWSLEATAGILLGERNMDAYWWYSRNMYMTARAMEASGYLPEGWAEHYRSEMVLAAEDSPIVRDLMLPREEMVRETYAKMMEFLNNNIFEITELAPLMDVTIKGWYRTREYQDFKKRIETFSDLYKAAMKIEDDEKRSAAFDSVTSRILNGALAKKAEIGDEAFNIYLLKMVRASWIRKNENILRGAEANWASSIYNNFDRWLYSGVAGASTTMMDLFYEAMVWFREKNNS